MEQNSGRTEISDLGEFGLIDHLTKNFETRHSFTVKGIGDDAAVIDNEGKLTVISTDLLIEGVHFDMMYSPLKHLGYKAVVVNLSDIFAMNATPRQVTVSIAISNRFSVEALEELYEGIHLACDRYEVDLVGGDTTSSLKGFVISVTAIGEAVEEKLAYRNAAKPGDSICVTGDLGSAYLGLQLLEREKRIYLENPGIPPDLGQQNYVIGRQLKPEARADIIKLFDRLDIVPGSMIDVSDGLSSDLFHLCKSSNVGALIYEQNVPIHPEAFNLALDFKLDPITCALNGGEDYELLFTLKEEDRKKLKNEWDFSVIGEIKARGEGVKIHTKGGNYHDLQAQGWTGF